MVRRRFIRNSGLLTAGILLNNSLTQVFAKNSENKLNIGVIGCGDRGNGIIQLMKELQDSFNVSGICDVLDFRLKEALRIAGSWQPVSYTDYRQLLDNKDINAVVIATPLNSHFSIAADALKAGKHVYLEKAMTYNIGQAQKLVKLSKDHTKQTLQVGHQYRYTPLYFKVKDMIEKGYLGKVTQIDCRWDRNWNWRRPVPDPSLERKINWRMYKEYSGGLPAELLSHQMDFINWAFQTHPDEIYGSGGIDFYKDGRETYDNVQVMFRYAKEGMIGNFGATCGNARDGYLFKLKGTKGTISLLMHDGVFYPEAQTKKELETVDGVTGSTNIVWNKEGGIPILQERTKDGTWYALKEFYKCVTTGAKPVSNVITGATTAVCVALSNKAIYNGTIEKWKPAYNFS